MKVGQIVGTVVGVGLIAAPAALDYAGTPAASVHRVIGPIVATVAAIALWGATASLRWANLAGAAALAVALLVVDHGGAAAAVGAVAALAVGLATPVDRSSTPRIGGGWAALLRRSA